MKRALSEPSWSPEQADALLDELALIVGSEHVLVDPAMRAGFEVDWTRRFRGTALAVVRPGSTHEVAAVMARCAAAHIGVVPQGGNTGLVGGAVPRSTELVLSLRRLSQLDDVDGLAAQVTAGAGVTLAQLQRVAAAADLDFGVDFAARDSATVGGMIATNAGGHRVLRYGTMRSQVLGIEAVLADGRRISRLGGVQKDNTGYHLPSLLAGSEGTLAVITRARLRLVAPVRRRAVALLALEGTEVAMRLVEVVRRAGVVLMAAELFFDAGLELVLGHVGEVRPFPVRHPAYLLLEVASNVDPLSELADVLSDHPEIFDAVLVDDPGGRSRLWRLREAHSEAVSAQGIAHKLDVGLPIARLAEFESRVRDVIASVAADARTIVWGHVGDGNLHVNVLGPDLDDESVDNVVLRLAIELGGSTCGEHGVGIAKTRWLPLDRTPGDLSAMYAIKRGMDPDGILNPGVLFSQS